MINRILKTLIFLKLIEAYKNSIDPSKHSINGFREIWKLIKGE